jgi:DNA-binding GntR family transcriptional regulator
MTKDHAHNAHGARSSAGAALLPQIRRLPLHDEVVKHLRQLILDGRLKPGSRVPERVVCEQLGVSRTPLREAFKVLATEGLIELLPNRGVVVSRLSAGDLDDMFPVLEALEALSGELACARITDEEIDEIRALHNAMRECYRRKERAKYFRINQQIHERILAAARNAVLSNVYSSLSSRIRRARFMSNITEEAWKKAAADHELILKAIEKRDGERLSRLLKAHLKHKRDGIKDALDASAGG